MSLLVGTCPLQGLLAHRTVANLPSHLRVKFLALEGSEPVAETRWSTPITLITGTWLVLPPTPSPQPWRGYGLVLSVWGGPRGLNDGQQRFGFL